MVPVVISVRNDELNFIKHILKTVKHENVLYRFVTF